ncbi:MAG: hypothetical protein WC477_06555 [Patescibacteria group bacterium]
MNKKQLLWLVIIFLVLGLIGIGTIVIYQNSQPATPARSQEAPPLPSAPAPKTYTDAKRGIRFVVPDGWTVGTDEGGNLDVIKGNPYQSVVFQVYTDKAVWQKMMDTILGFTEDKLIKKGTTEVGNLPTTSYVFQRSTGGSSSFQYVHYFIDGGTKWYDINTSDPSPEIEQIIQSVSFSSGS